VLNPKNYSDATLLAGYAIKERFPSFGFFIISNSNTDSNTSNSRQTKNLLLLP